MRFIAAFIAFILFITIFVPMILIKGCNVVFDEEKIEEVEEVKTINILNVSTNKVEEMEFEEYIKGVVAAEMPAAFHIEALKAQAVAARTYSIYRISKFKNGHPDHPEAPLCTSTHCQAWYSMDKLRELHSKNWMIEYWPKIEEAVESTKGEILMYNGKIVEPLFHSTSGGMTEDSENVFASQVPYLRSVSSPYEDRAPKLKDKISISTNQFINKLKQKYMGINLTKSNLAEKILLIEKSDSGRIMKIKIDNRIVSGREIRELFNLNSTNFKISVYPSQDKIEIETTGYGHGVGMSQWGANGMAENGSNYKEILKHYYTGVGISTMY